jgi:deoxycytidylate deaminase
MTKEVLSRKNIVEPVRNPELVFGLVGPIGVQLDLVVNALQTALESVGYKHEIVHVTDLMNTKKISIPIDETSYSARYHSLIRYANQYRKVAGNSAALAARAILEIRKLRFSKSGDEASPALSCAYIVRQFKRPEEIELMRKVYGRKFIQVSVSGTVSERKKILAEKIRTHTYAPKKNLDIEQEIALLIDTDFDQQDRFGQKISDVFHLGDVFVRGVEQSEIEKTVRRFIDALFGHNGTSPNKDEYGLYAAAGAALRSIDLSRQVGAAIFTNNGEIISLGCNEVPKAHGGTYWSDQPNPFRDFEIGHDQNHNRKAEILYDFSLALSNEKMLNSKLSRMSQDQLYKTLAGNKNIKNTQLMDIIEFGRMIHAEMSAISDAARLGRPTKEATLFCTTFPCHICAKHIVAAGIERVVYLEPYPKSYAERLHSDSITFEPEEKSKVLFQPFIGVSPRRYRDIFEKKTRKEKESGRAKKWYFGKPAPMIEDTSASYTENEKVAAPLLSGFSQRIKPNRK